MKTIEIKVSGGLSRIVVGFDLLRDLSPHVDLAGVEQVVVIADRGAAGHWREVIDDRFGLAIPMTAVMMPQGETSKTLEVAGGLLNQLADLKLRRNDLLMTFGGGMISDLGGFVGSIYQRGVKVIHLPTTLLGQVDAAIGGKTGVNLRGGKNLVGTFHHPSAVIADVQTLQTLPEAEFRSGLAEVLKYGFAMDRHFLERLEKSHDRIAARGPDLLQEIVGRCVELKAEVVEEDEFDRGRRAILNYGHTVGHALEAAGGYERWLHGEAISVGMAAAARLSQESGHLDMSDVTEHLRILEKFGLPITANFSVDEVMGFIGMDKKYESGQRWILLRAMGEAIIERDIEESAVRGVLEKVKST